MTLPTPNLDDRTFQGLVDDAKRYVQQRCPAWTDHNVSDPGVTLIEAFAWMTDMLLYRLNRVPDRNYVKFLEFIGLRLFPPTAAHANISFRLGAPPDEVLTVPIDTVVSTLRTTTEDAVTFSTTDAGAAIPARSVFVGSIISEDQMRDHTAGLGAGVAFACFADPPQPDDALYIALERAAPSNVLLVEFDCEVGGHGIDPTHPPLQWEAWNGDRWERCEIERDSTGGLNLTGSVEIHLPAKHEPLVLGVRSHAWVRCRVVQTTGAAYRSSPKILAVDATTIGVDVDVVHGEIVRGEFVGTSEGVPGQVFATRRAPVAAAGGPPVLEVRARSLGSGDDGPWEEWTAVANFADSGPDDRHFTIDHHTGELRLGPAIRASDGSLLNHGKVPPKGATLRMRSYRTGGGRAGNVAPRTISVLRTSIPSVAAVYNRAAAVGGVDGETIDEARERGPILLRTRNRAVTAEDYEVLVREAAPEIARVCCTLGDDGVVRVLLVPDVRQEFGRIRLDQLVPDDATGARVAEYLEHRRVLGTRVVVEPPSYLGVTVVAELIAETHADPELVEARALTALYEYFHPLVGGPDRRGWPFGRPVHVGEAYATLQRVGGVDLVDDLSLFIANPVTGARSDAVERIDLDPTNLVLSFEHEVRVVPA